MEDLTLSLVVFRIEGQRYGLPLEAVRRVLPMIAVSPLPDAPDVAIGVINLHGELLPVIDLRRRLGAAPRPWALDGRLLVAQSRRRSVVLPVDDVLDVMRVPAAAVIAPQQLLPGVPQVAGLVALADGVLFIHDLDAVLALDEEQQLGDALEAAGP